LHAEFLDLLLDACAEKHQDEAMQFMLSRSWQEGNEGQHYGCQHYCNVMTFALQGTQETRFQGCIAKYDVECTKLLAAHGTRQVPSAEK